MRTLILVSMFFVACSSAAPAEQGLVGPQGEVGPVGPKGDVGPAGAVGATGPQGPAGKDGISAVSVASLDGGACPNGGALLVDTDGGSVALCNGVNGRDGATGATGATGPQGATGAQGPQGLPAKALAVWGADGGIVGPAITNNMLVAFAYIEEYGCVGAIDYFNNKISPLDANIYFTQPNCSGSAYSADSQQVFFPVGCIKNDGHVYKVRQPVMRNQVTTASYRWTAVDQNNVSHTYCVNQPGTAQVPIDEVVGFVEPVGPFIMGMR